MTGPDRNSAPRHAQPQVFSDPRRRRHVLVRRVFALLVVAIGSWAAIFATTLATSGKLAERLAGGPAFLEARDIGQRHRGSAMPLLSETAETLQGLAPALPDPGCAQTPSDQQRVYALMPSSADWSHLSLKRACGAIDVLMPEWLHITADTLSLARDALDPDAEAAVAAYRRERGAELAVVPTLRLADASAAVDLNARLNEASFRAGLIAQANRTLDQMQAQGLCVDLAAWPDARYPGLVRFLEELRDDMASRGRSACLVIGAGQVFWRDNTLTGAVDKVVLRLYDQPWIASPASPLAMRDWFAKTAADAVERIGRDRLVVALGTGGSDWISGRPMPERVSYAEAMTRIVQAGARVGFATDAGNSNAVFVGSGGQRHRLWLLDAASANNQVLALARLGLRSVAISDLGHEDPGVWDVLDPARSSESVAAALRSVVVDRVSYSGEGPFLRYLTPAVPGRRSMEFAGREIVGQIYQQTPSSARIQRYGRAAPTQIALTFDDGPDPAFTAAILDALQAERAPATFFLVGNNALRAQDLVRRMVDEGHEIGSHTFMHPRMDQISYYRSVVEVNSVQKLVGGITGRAMLLYREPFLRGSGPLTASRAESLRMLQEAGYVIAGSDIVPLDWKDTPAEEIVANVMAELHADGGNVIVLHDAGSDRAETVRAVPLLIEALRAEGYDLVSLASILGVAPEALMPVTGEAAVSLDSVSFNAVALMWDALVLVFWAAIVIGAVRSGAVILLALRRRASKALYSAAPPSVTVVIPAYNEEVVINDAVARALASKYPNLEVIVVDDGSRDRTLARVEQAYGQHPQVRILSQRNGGKWSALNLAYRHIDTDIAVCIDADTQIGPEAIAWLCRHFADPKVGAVAGKLLIGNKVNLLTRLQALEYATAQNIDRRAAELLNGMLVVPGAIGAWRVEAVRRAGLYSGATLSEDADLTVSVVRQGYRVVYEERALAETEAPAKLGAFLKQRLRWSLGMLQTGWKHRGAIREGRAIGVVSLIDLAVFGYLFPVLAPVADAFFFYFLWDLAQIWWAGTPGAISGAPSYLFLGYLALPLMDIVTALMAIRLDRRESYGLVLLFPFQRLFYRQILYFTVFRALLRALTGTLAKWQKADRTGLAIKVRVR